MIHGVVHDSRGEDAAWANPEDAPIFVDRSDPGYAQSGELEIVAQCDGRDR